VPDVDVEASETKPDSVGGLSLVIISDSIIVFVMGVAVEASGFKLDVVSTRDSCINHDEIKMVLAVLIMNSSLLIRTSFKVNTGIVVDPLRVRIVFDSTLGRSVRVVEGDRFWLMLAGSAVEIRVGVKLISCEVL
jgi:hypothetical protein